MRVVVVPAAEAEDVRRELHARGLVNRAARITKRGADVLIPVVELPPLDLARRGPRVEDVGELSPRPRPPNPRLELEQRLQRYGVPPGVAPTKWARFEDVIVVRLSEEARRYGAAIGTAFAETLDARCVVEDVSGIHGVLRTPEVRILWGRGMEVVHVEDGVRFMFDVATIMFSSGNLPERTSIAAKVRDGDVVVDLFAGIGYFTLPIAVHANASRIYACELNPVAYHYLVESLRLNRASNVMPLFGDCRETAPRGVADVVLLGHFSAADYLDVAFRALRGAGLVVYHELCPREHFPQSPIAHLTEGARAHWYDVESVQSRIVKSYAPGIVHAVLEARVQRRPKAPASP
ncbi:MAG TPA: class I SAM-dependent methyltransferase family protein [Thermoplasmata archaeon]|nr:class I SAM-dependent methyltransferase family protein [Thermoplasmata archaeon]